MSEPTQNQAPLPGDITFISRQVFNGWNKYVIPTNDEIILSRGGSKTGFMVYDELERDAKVSEQLQKRRLALLSREWIVEPASEGRADKKAADFIREQFNLLGYDRLTGYFFDAVVKGISFVEPIWERDGAQVLCTDVIHCEPWLFNFSAEPTQEDLVVNRYALRLLSPDNMNTGVAIPPKKMMVHKFGSRYSNPWGIGLGNRLFWPVFFKRQGIEFWLSFAERFGTPIPWGKYPQTATPGQKATLLNALQGFRQEGAIATPIGMELELLQAASSGIDTYDRLAAYMDSQISGIVLGKSGGKDSGGQLATAIAVENEVRLELVKGDADLIDHAMNTQLVRWLIDCNMPGAGYPTVRRVISEPVDTKALAETFKTIVDMGFEPSEQQITDNFGAGWTKKTVTVQPKPDINNPAFAAPNAGDNLELAGPQPEIDGLIALDAAAHNLPGSELDEQAAGLLDAPIAAVLAADSFETALKALEASATEQDVETFAAGLHRALFASKLLGKAEAV